MTDRAATEAKVMALIEPFNKKGVEVTEATRFAQDLEEVILTTTSGRPAAFIAETILGVGGYVVPPPGYFQKAAEIIRRYGGLLIIDEVQAGFGRTGGKWFGIEHWDVEPDIMVMAKGIANGFPVGATITRPEIAEAWKTKTISTFGGNPLACAGALANLEYLLSNDLQGNARKQGEVLKNALQRLVDRYPFIVEVRGRGLMLAIEMCVPGTEGRLGGPQPWPAGAAAFMEATRARGDVPRDSARHGPHPADQGPQERIPEGHEGPAGLHEPLPPGGRGNDPAHQRQLGAGALRAAPRLLRALYHPGLPG